MPLEDDSRYSCTDIATLKGLGPSYIKSFIKIFKGEIKKDVKKSFDPLIVKTFYIRRS